MTWRAAALTREAWRNVASNPVRSLVTVTIAAAAFATLAWLELRQAEDLARFQAGFAAAGGYVAVVSSQNGGVDAARCEALSAQPGVVAAGSDHVTGAVTLLTAPGVLFQSVTVTPGALRAWSPGAALDPAPPDGSYAVGPALAKEAGLKAGSYTGLAGEPVSLVSMVVDVSRRNPQASRWLMSVAPPSGRADECWVEFDRGSYQPGMAALGAWFSNGSTEPTVRPYIRRDEFIRDAAAEFVGRPQRWGWLADGGFFAALFALTAWFRRAELGLYLALGTPRGTLTTLLALEAAIVLAVSLCVAVLWTFAAWRLADFPLPWDQARLALRGSASGALLGAILAPVAASLLARGNVAALLKDR